MPTISLRGEQMPPSPIRKLVPYADKAKSQGIDILHLNIGQPDIPTPLPMMHVLKTLDIPVLAYSHSAGFDFYREKLVTYYHRNRINISSEEIIVTTGGSEAIIFAFMACMDPGDEIIIPEPFYANYLGFAVEAGVKIVPVTANISDGFALPPIESFKEKITDRTKAILICNPNNPTGYLYTKTELESLKNICLEHQLFLMSDEAYREFCYDNKSHFSVMELDGINEIAVLLDTVSKRYSACGARIGAFVSKNKTLNASVLKFAQARLSPPSIEQYMATAAVDLPETYFDQTKEEYQERRNALVEGLRKIPGVICPNPGGAFYVVIELPIDDSDVFCQWMLEHFSYEGYTLMMAPAKGFYSNTALGNKQVRLAYVLEKHLIEKSIEVLKHGLVAYQEKMNNLGYESK